METSTEAPPDPSEVLRRSWQDLETWRLTVGLVAAPVLPILLVCALSAFVSPGLLGSSFSLLWIAVPAEIWSVIFGTSTL
jgi:hypothetical protein